MRTHQPRLLVVLWLLPALAPAQALRLAPVTQSSGTIVVDVASNHAAINVTNTSTGEVTSHPVPPGKRVTIPVPANLPPGAILTLSVGRGLNAHRAVIEIASP